MAETKDPDLQTVMNHHDATFLDTVVEIDYQGHRDEHMTNHATETRETQSRMVRRT
jgi:hypothetical protein